MPVGAFCAFLALARLVRYFNLFLGHAHFSFVFSENFPKLDIDTFSGLCYNDNKFLHGLFCKKVNILVNVEAYGKADLL